MKIQPQMKASGNKWLHLRAAKTVRQTVWGEIFTLFAENLSSLEMCVLKKTKNATWK